ncbi:MAG: hypothetical protein IPH57_17705 [Saprospiraceae bacterium]|nr:hypothetical protein [Saprospiraceae bacterium]
MDHRFKCRRGFFILIPIAIFFAVTAVVMLLWNAILPVVLGIKAISYWQAGGILVLSRILFGNFGFGKHRWHHSREMRERFFHMTDEEKQEFKEKWKERKCC